MKDTFVTLVKSTAKVSKIFSVSDTTLSISSDSITVNEDRTITIKDINITTDLTGTFYVVITCRGYNSGFMHSGMKIMIEEKVNIVIYFVKIFEGIIAFAIAMMIITSSSI